MRSLVRGGIGAATALTLVSTGLAQGPQQQLGAFFGTNAGDNHGYAVASLDDLTGDGMPEIAVGEPRGPLDEGRVRVFDGATLALLFDVDLDAKFLGRSIAGIGDLTGDGAADLVVGSPFFSPTGQTLGRVDVVDSATQNSVAVFTGPGSPNTISWGERVVALGDVDGDSHDDYAFDSSSYLLGVSVETVHVISGQDHSVLYFIPRPDGIADFGAAIAPISDVTGDFLPDILIGGSSTTLVAGIDGTILSKNVLPPAKEIQPLGDVNFTVDGYEDFALGDTDGDMVRVIDGKTFGVLWQSSGAAGDTYGRALAQVGDRDGDNRPELAIGAPREGSTFRGYVEVRSSVTGCLLSTVDGSGFVNGFGWDIAPTGDIDGDGEEDFIVGAPAEQVSGQTTAGASRIYRNKPNGSPVGTLLCHCPNGGNCANGHGSIGGCHNSVTLGTTGGGGLLEAYGSTSLTANDLFFHATRLRPDKLATTAYDVIQPPVPWRDGLRCLVDPTRLLTQKADATGALITGPCLSAELGMGGVMSGQTIGFQVYYRDGAGPCGFGANVTNAVEIMFTN